MDSGQRSVEAAELLVPLSQALIPPHLAALFGIPSMSAASAPPAPIAPPHANPLALLAAAAAAPGLCSYGGGYPAGYSDALALLTRGLGAPQSQLSPGPNPTATAPAAPAQPSTSGAGAPPAPVPPAHPQALNWAAFREQHNAASAQNQVSLSTSSVRSGQGGGQEAPGPPPSDGPAPSSGTTNNSSASQQPPAPAGFNPYASILAALQAMAAGPSQAGGFNGAAAAAAAAQFFSAAGAAAGGAGAGANAFAPPPYPYFPRADAAAALGFGYPYGGPGAGFGGYPYGMDFGGGAGGPGGFRPSASQGQAYSGSLDDEFDDGTARAVKRPRLVWTPQLHKKFESAVAKLGDDKAVPKNIMQEMNIDGLTRENVASHLQKYRMQKKKVGGGSSEINGSESCGGAE